MGFAALHLSCGRRTPDAGRRVLLRSETLHFFFYSEFFNLHPGQGGVIGAGALVFRGDFALKTGVPSFEDVEMRLQVHGVSLMIIEI
jgi:hypothetical protein